MQDALPALVLNSEAVPRNTMDETPSTEANPSGSRAAGSTGVTDERLMLAFSQGSSEAFSELFLRYKQPIYGFFRRRVAESSQAEELTQESAPPLATNRAPSSAPTSTPSASRYFAPIVAKPPSASPSSVKEIPRSIPRSEMPPSLACGSAAPSRSSNPWTAKFCSCASSSN